MIEQLRQGYRGKKVFLTGHTGFKGSWLALWLKELGAEVVAFSLPPEDVRGNHFNLLQLDQEVTSYFGDIQNYEALYQALRESEAEIVFHLSAQSLVRRSYRDPINNYATNVMGTVHLLEAVRHTPSVKAVVNITTDKCYDNKEWEWAYRETDELGGHDPYSSSKACAELISAAYRTSFFAEQGIALATARAGNVIGGGDFAEDRIIPDIVEALAKGEPVFLRNPHAVRPWQHVLDALYGYLLLGIKLLSEENQSYQTAYNFSPVRVESITVEQMTQKFIAAIGKGSYQVDQTRANLHEARLLKLDPSRAITTLGWQPILDAQQAVSFTADWFSAYLADSKATKSITMNQIHQFMSYHNKGVPYVTC
jgi:CDP-glucose 4,6-dehydratase